MIFSSDVAEQYFQESMAHLKDHEGKRRAKFLLIQDDFCHFLQTTGQKEVSGFRSHLVIHMDNLLNIQRGTL
jgi:hypothetical protein